MLAVQEQGEVEVEVEVWWWWRSLKSLQSIYGCLHAGAEPTILSRALPRRRERGAGSDPRPAAKTELVNE